jgi:hypothetical protein
MFCHFSRDSSFFAILLVLLRGCRSESQHCLQVIGFATFETIDSFTAGNSLLLQVKVVAEDRNLLTGHE